jgi:hypothetical protein
MASITAEFLDVLRVLVLTFFNTSVNFNNLSIVRIYKVLATINCDISKESNSILSKEQLLLLI